MHPYRRLRMVMATAPGTSACAACRVLRRKCTAQCLFAPFFPPDQPQKFAHVHKVFGVANVTKMLHELPPPHRQDCVNSLAYEADARVQDPVYGCVGAISVLQQQFRWPDEKNPWKRTSVGPSFSGSSWLKVAMFRFLHATAFTCFSCKDTPLVAHLQTQLALATSEIARLRETFTIAAAASTKNSSPPASNINAPANGGPPVFLASLQPPQSPPQAPDNSLPAILDHPAPPPTEPRHQEPLEPTPKQPVAASCETLRPASS